MSDETTITEELPTEIAEALNAYADAAIGFGMAVDDDDREVTAARRGLADAILRRLRSPPSDGARDEEIERLKAEVERLTEWLAKQRIEYAKLATRELAALSSAESARRAVEGLVERYGHLYRTHPGRVEARLYEEFHDELQEALKSSAFLAGERGEVDRG